MRALPRERQRRRAADPRGGSSDQADSLALAHRVPAAHTVVAYGLREEATIIAVILSNNPG